MDAVIIQRSYLTGALNTDIRAVLVTGGPVLYLIRQRSNEVIAEGLAVQLTLVAHCKET